MEKSSSCCDKDGVKKGPWTAEEDQKLIDYIQKHGHGKWRTLPKNAGLKRCGKSCRLRWTNYLRPDIKRGKFSIEEEEIIIQLHKVLGNKWSTIAARLPGRTDNEIKNYWNTHIRKKLLRMGIDPVTHCPRLDLLQLSSILSSSLFKSSSQPNIPNLLGMMPGLTLNPELLSLALTLFSNQNKIPPQNNIQENPYQYFQPNQLQTLVQASTTSSSNSINAHQFVNENQFISDRANLHRFSSTSFTDLLNCQGSYLNPWDNSRDDPHGYFPLMNHGNTNYHDSSNLSISDPSRENPSFCVSDNNCENIVGLRFASLLSSATPSSSSTPLNSSSTAFVNGGSEDERDSFCSNILMFDNPSGLSV